MAGTSIRMEADLRPAYYDDFRCILGVNCCDKGWSVQQAGLPEGQAAIKVPRAIGTK